MTKWLVPVVEPGRDLAAQYLEFTPETGGEELVDQTRFGRQAQAFALASAYHQLTRVGTLQEVPQRDLEGRGESPQREERRIPAAPLDLADRASTDPGRDGERLDAQARGDTGLAQDPAKLGHVLARGTGRGVCPVAHRYPLHGGFFSLMKEVGKFKGK